MTHFKRAFARFLCPKFRKQHRQPDVVAPTESTDRSVVEPSIDAVVEEVEESGDEDEVRETHLDQTVQHSTDAVLTKVEMVEESEDSDSHNECDDEDEDNDVPEVFPYDLVHKTHCQRVIRGLYVAVADNDREIAALRTVHRAKFTHIIRVVFNPLSRNNIMPSSWAVQEIYPDDGPHELRLRCPPLMRHYDGKLTALRENQLLATRNYIARALPHRNDMWAEQGHKLPFSLDEGEDTILIIAPPDRPADVMAILVCYMAFLVGMSAEEVLGGLRRSKALVHSHWGGDILGKDSLDMVNVVSKHK
ncbi:hypothetical protein JVT61DRAFT_14499 [Boletus reticuloceps]|uniref:Uncharacterized protein n=1 Tax=Boletus reticuloceps TaxID=495285 RepID=A0A8I2YU01_9AGAM|nr:hypothetical protein JVT61DRAFT_14499 [Boletus reticuloceps]